MKKTTYIRFTEKGARIGINYKPEGEGKLLVNPDLSKVAGIPPHLWKLVGEEVLPPGAPTPKLNFYIPSRLRWFLIGAASGAVTALGVVQWLM